ncbi:hypothetical protein [Leifsonia virtsii]|uniref:Uncharacterized protein n=1 Tax=Leifsonia virtsii TaxID=3035915 RepID=A0ABT8IW09_9MICO|nr:hypothetical protein [Leifsonia virtsii]MDN4596552.1 hypothetical protein [Leifsonia virtsii]
MSAGRPARSGALLEMAGVAVVWAVLLFAIAVVVLQVLSVLYASQIDTVLRVFGMSAG